MFNLKKIEPKFPKLNFDQIKRKNTYSSINKEAFINLDINISEREVDSVNLEKFKTIEKEKIKNDLIKKVPTKIKPKQRKNNNKYKLFNDNYSATTNCSDFKGIKKVTFSTVEIIRVAKYKKYNACNNFSNANIQKNINEVKNSKIKDDIPCMIF